MANQYSIGDPLLLNKVDKAIKPKQVLVWDESTRLVKRIAVDETVKKNSNNLITSGAVYNIVNGLAKSGSDGESGLFDPSANYTITGLWTFNHSTGVVVGSEAITDTKIAKWNAALQGDETETISAVWTYSARPAFNGGDASSSPFTVDSSKVVTNLNAALLDVAGTGRAASTSSTANTIAARDSSKNIYANDIYFGA